MPKRSGLVDEEKGAGSRFGQFTRLPSEGFSKAILEPNAKHLRVIRVEGVSWSDWRNQDRVVNDLSKMVIAL
ncbi:MAG: hypothetical protein ABSB78_09780 [Bacteroidota bacterium]